MKKILILLLIAVSGQSYAQRPIYIKVKHTKGVYGIDAQYLLSKEGKGFAVGYFSYPWNKVFFNLSGEYEKGEVGFTDFTNLNGRAKINYCLFDIKNKVYLNAFGSARGGAELVRLSASVDDPDGYYKDENKFLASGGIGATAEGFITSKFVLTVSFEQILYSRSIVGKQFYNYQIGLQYILN